MAHTHTQHLSHGFCVNWYMIQSNVIKKQRMRCERDHLIPLNCQPPISHTLTVLMKINKIKIKKWRHSPHSAQHQTFQAEMPRVQLCNASHYTWMQRERERREQNKTNSVPLRFRSTGRYIHSSVRLVRPFLDSSAQFGISRMWWWWWWWHKSICSVPRTV